MYETQPFCEVYNSKQNEIRDSSVRLVGGETTQSISVVSRTVVQPMVTVLIERINIGNT
jgi:hypothetical protein